MNPVQTVRNRVRCGVWVVLIGAVCVSLTGCGRFRWKPRPKPQLLGPRTIVPPPYMDPADTGTVIGGPVYHPDASALPAPGTGFSEPALPDEGLVAPPDEDMGSLPDEASPPDDPAVPDEGIVLPPVVQSDLLTYEVRKGDSLWKVARMYGITHQELAAYNSLDEKAILPVGKVLNIPPGGRFIPEENRPPIRPVEPTRPGAAAPVRSGAGTTATTRTYEPIPADGRYTVVAGDSLWKIARRFGLKSKDIRELNGLTTDVLQIDQVLILPPADTTDAAPDPTPTGRPDRPERTTIPIRPTRPMEPVADRDPRPADPPDAGDDAVGDTVPGLPDVPQPALAFPKTLDHTVAKGETLNIIAEMYGTAVEDILKANPGIKSDADLKVNTKILVPYR